jgi:hypothetical protein
MVGQSPGKGNKTLSDERIYWKDNEEPAWAKASQGRTDQAFLKEIAPADQPEHTLALFWKQVIQINLLVREWAIANEGGIGFFSNSKE